VVHGFAAAFGGFNGDGELFTYAGLAGEIGQGRGTESRFKLPFFFDRRRRDGAIRGHANFTLAHGGEGSAEEWFKLGRCALFLHFAKGLFGSGARAAEILESGEDVAFEVGIGGSGFHDRDRFAGGVDRHELVFEFEDDALGGLFADAGDADETWEVTAADGGDEFGSGEAGEDRDGEFRADAADGDEAFEDGFFFRRGEAEEQECVFANVGVDAKGGGGALVWEGGEGGDGDLDVVADAGSFEDDLVRMLFEDGAAEVGDHKCSLAERGRGVAR
jgi:hypothetical protein